jgi:hypothetical protein
MLESSGGAVVCRTLTESDVLVEALSPTYSATISDDGQRVAFPTRANLDPADTDGSRTCTCATSSPERRPSPAGRPGCRGRRGDDTNADPSLSGDGRYVAFETFARLDPADQDDFIDSYVRTLALPQVCCRSSTN